MSALIVGLLITLIVSHWVSIYRDDRIVKRNYDIMIKSEKNLESELKFWKGSFNNLVEVKISKTAFIISHKGISNLPEDWEKRLGVVKNED